MIESFKKDLSAKIVVVLFLLLTVWWFLSPSFQKTSGERFFGDFPSIYAIVALFGAVCGAAISQKWGGIKSLMGRAILMFSFGLFAQVFGQVVYAYYSFYQHVSVPYPSLGDLGYFGSIPLYIYGVWLLAKVSGVKIGLQSFKHQMLALLIPLLILGVSYFLFLNNYTFDWTNPVKIFLDFGYPFGQAIYISLAILTYLLSRNTLGGMMKNKVLFILF